MKKDKMGVEFRVKILNGLLTKYKIILGDCE